MTQSRRWTSLVVLAFMVLTLLSACSGQPAAAPTPTPPPTKPAEPSLSDPKSIKGDIVVWWWGETSTFDAWMPDFKAAYPNVNVSIEKMSFDDVHNKLIAALAAGEGAPDVSAIEIGYVSKFAMQGGLVNMLAKPYNAGQFKDQFLEHKWQQGLSPDGRLVAMPWDIGPAAFFYRRDVFEKAGLPSDPAKVADLVKTWDGFIEAGKKIKASGAAMVANPMDIYTIYNMKYGFFDKDWNVAVDGAKGKKALDLAKKVHAAGIDAGLDTWSGDWQQALNNGKIATLYGGTWMEGTIKGWINPDGKGKWGVFPVPEDPGQEWGGSFLTIPEQSKNKLAAWAFIQFGMTSAANHVKMFQVTGQFPSLKAAQSDKAYDAPDEWLGGQTNRLWIDISNQLDKAPITTPMDTVAESKLDGIVGPCITNNTDTVKCLADAKKEIEAATATDKKIALNLKNAGKKP